jgi:predicted acyltransferase
VRYSSVDILRGFTVAIMILVNNPGSWSYVHPWLEHAPWNGCRLADLVFPFFLFIVGLSIVFALSKALEAGGDKKKLALKSLKRGFILFALGLFLNAFPDFDFQGLRIPGVLQRIGLVFAITALLFIYTTERQRRIVMLVVLLGYWALLTLVPVPGLGEASMEKGKDLGAWIDNLVMHGHLWKYSVTWDPEGLLSTLPAMVSALLGVSAGVYMRKTNTPVKALAFSGVLLVGVGLVWNLVFPMNKALWTSSYVLFTAGVAFLLLALSIYLFDERGIQKGTTVFRALGANPLAAYFGSELLAKSIISFKVAGHTLSEWSFGIYTSFFTPSTASIVSAFVTVFLWAMVALVLYRKKIFIKI